MALKFTEENFNKEVLESDSAVLVDFYADWCGPCKMMAPVIDEIATEFDGIAKVGKLDVDNAQELSAKYRVMSIPTLIVFKNGEPKETIVGVVSKDEVVNKLNLHK